MKRELTPSDEHELSEDEIESKPATPKEPKPSPKSKSQSARSKSPKSPKKPSSDPSSPKKMGAWSGEELKMLYGIMCPKKVGVNWSDVSSQIPGHDRKACINRWSRMQGQILQAIEDLGE